MSNLFFIHDITIYHLVDDENVEIKHFNNVYFRHNKKANVIDKGIERASTGSVVIPTDENIGINIDDIIVDGIVNDEYNYRTLASKYHLYKVLSVDDNRKGNLKHWKLGVAD